MTNMNVILEAKDIVKTYGYEDNKIYATNHIDLQIEEGSFVAIVGRSGSGKSTLLHILAGLVKPTKGEVYLEGKSLYEMNDHTLTGVLDEEEWVLSFNSSILFPHKMF